MRPGKPRKERSFMVPSAAELARMREKHADDLRQALDAASIKAAAQKRAGTRIFPIEQLSEAFKKENAMARDAIPASPKKVPKEIAAKMAEIWGIKGNRLQLRLRYALQHLRGK